MTIIVIDLWIRGNETLFIHGLADEIAHVLTAGICIGALRSLGVKIPCILGLIGAVLLDLDHIPLIFGWVEPLAGSTRPGTHALWPIAALLIVGLVYRGKCQVFWALAIGIATHLFRDMATGTVVLFWPVSDAVVSIPYVLYLAVMFAGLLLIRLAANRQVRGAPEDQASQQTGHLGSHIGTEAGLDVHCQIWEC